MMRLVFLAVAGAMAVAACGGSSSNEETQAAKPVAEAQPKPAGARLRSPCTSIRRNGAACATAHRSAPETGNRLRFSAERQKFCVALPPNQPASTVTSPWIVVSSGFRPRPMIEV